MIWGIGVLFAWAAPSGALTVAETRANMSSDERFAYVGGVIEGLAFARWITDNRSTEGRDCILNWYFANDNESARFNRQMGFFDEHPDQHISTLMYALIREECGE